MDSTNDGIWLYADMWPNFVVENEYTRTWGFKIVGVDWEEYKHECYRLAPKELMVWEDE